MPPPFDRVDRRLVRTIEIVTRMMAHTPAAAAVASTANRNDTNIPIGGDGWYGVARKSDRSNWPNDTMKANNDPAVMPDEMFGNVTLVNALIGPAPRPRAASSSDRSNPYSAADTAPITNGVVTNT